MLRRVKVQRGLNESSVWNFLYVFETFVFKFRQGHYCANHFSTSLRNLLVSPNCLDNTSIICRIQ